LTHRYNAGEGDPPTKFLTYNPDHGSLLPPRVESVLGRNHLCFVVRRMVEKLDLSAFASGYEKEGRLAYHPALRVSVGLYADALEITSSRRLEQRVTPAVTDNATLAPVVEAIEQRWGEAPVQVSADSGFFEIGALQQLVERKIDAYGPDSNLGRVLNRGGGDWRRWGWRLLWRPRRPT